MDAGKFVVTWAAPGVLGRSGPEVRRFKNATELLLYLGRDWPHSKRPKTEAPMPQSAVFVSHREVRL
jgi:hypothetical protein